MIGHSTPPEEPLATTMDSPDSSVNTVHHPTRLIWLPSAITTIALVAGFVSVVLAADPSEPNRFLYIPLLVGLAVFCDGLDGRVYRVRREP
ncbi:MAG TPA: hypothetical protein VFU69_17680 [Ktedonobacterales bacterium]|nr:hypothetical protein [Ktedonobacterales bacterium]